MLNNWGIKKKREKTEQLAVQCYKIVFIMNNTLVHMTLCQPIKVCLAVKMIESGHIILGLG